MSDDQKKKRNVIVDIWKKVRNVKLTTVILTGTDKDWEFREMLLDYRSEAIQITPVPEVRQIAKEAASLLSEDSVNQIIRHLEVSALYVEADEAEVMLTTAAGLSEMLRWAQPSTPSK